MNKNDPQTRLEKLYNHAELLEIDEDQPLVFFSDLHLGNGTKRDDFKKNADLVSHTLEKYYFKKGFHLFLNGDIEELLKFRNTLIYKKWENLYSIFKKFETKHKLYKLIGNHDPLHYLNIGEKHPFKLYNAIRLQYGQYPFFVFHGHQSSLYYQRLGRLIKFFIHFIARPLNIKNFSRAFNYEKKSAIEWDSYQFAKNKGIISIIGHSHRPLFESISQRDARIMKMERYLSVNSARRVPEFSVLKVPLLGKFKQDQRSLFSTGLSSGMNLL